MKLVKKTRWVLVAGLGFVMLISGIVFEAHAQPRKVSVAPSLPRYVPPQFSAPTGRMGAGTRGMEDQTFQILALAPDHVALTVQDQPSLYWYLSQATSLPVEFTISEKRAVKPLLETRLPSPVSRGIQRVQLAEYNVRLNPGVVYRWYVSVIHDREQRSRDVVTSGVIQRQEVPEDLAARLSGTDKRRKPHIYAAAGFWYDAIMAISELIEATPSNPQLHRQRAALMEQVGLPEAAAHDRQTN